LTIFFLFKNEGFIENVSDFATEIAEILGIISTIMSKLIEQLIQLNTKREYFDDPEDPPIPKIEETLYFVACENYMRYKGLIKFNFGLYHL
jgi:hypothetical protein